MAEPNFQKVLCVDPYDPQGIKHRWISLLIQTGKPFRGAQASPSISLGWNPQPTLVSPVRMIDEVNENTIIRNIQILDPKYGNMIVQYITSHDPDEKFSDASITTDKNEIGALWFKAVRAPKYEPGQARAAPALYKDGEIYMDGTRSDFVATYNATYPATEEVSTDDVPSYCDCQIKGDDGLPMIQCANGERFCFKEWYHLECIGMEEDDVPEGDWYCKGCVEGRLGNLKQFSHVAKEGNGVHMPRKKTRKKFADKIRMAEAKARAEIAADGLERVANRSAKAAKETGAAIEEEFFPSHKVIEPAPS